MNPYRRNLLVLLMSRDCISEAKNWNFTTSVRKRCSHEGTSIKEIQIGC